ncbi:MAG: flavin reductase family protein [Bacteroidota bacterium]
MQKSLKTLLYLSIITLFIACNSSAQDQINDLDNFEKISWRDIDDNAIRLIGKDWMLVAAGSVETDYNMMTASWGSLGWLWQKPVSLIYVRPQRFTHNFTEREDFYTISFYEESQKDILKKMGTVSGRNFDKMDYEKLTPVATENGSVAFKEAYLIIECRKIYASVLDENDFVDKAIVEDMYPKKDYHTLYVGEITNVWKKK